LADEERVMKFVPQNEIDLQLVLTNSQWGSSEQTQLRKILQTYKYKVVQVESGNGQQLMLQEKQNYWDLMEFFTRDLRLGNLKENELFVIRYDLDLATDLLSNDCFKSFITALSRVAVVLETSQSRGGFLRKIIQSIFKHETHDYTGVGENKQRGFLGIPGLKMGQGKDKQY